jgi:hypothetical protein
MGHRLASFVHHYGFLTLLAGVAGCGSVGQPSIFMTSTDSGTSDGSGGSGHDGGIHLGGDSGTHPGAPKSLFFVPAAATVVVDGTGNQQAKFKLEAKLADGSTVEVTPTSVEFDRPDLATLVDGSPVVATAPSSSALYGGTGTIHAIYDGKSATATLTVKVHLVAYGTGLTSSSTAVTKLNGTGLPSDPAPGISPLLYPYDQTVWPLGLNSPILMWNAPQAGDVYRLHYQEADYEFDGYYTLGSLPGQLQLDQTVWDRLTASNLAATTKDPLAFTLYRWDSISGDAYTTSTQTWTIAPESLQGAIYYWTASKDSSGDLNGHITKFQPGSGAAPVILNSGQCMGCHAVNAQGTVLVADIDDEAEDMSPPGTHTVPSVAPYDNWSGTRPWASFDITKPTIPEIVQTTKFGADIALTPDGKYTVFGGQTTATGSMYISLGIVTTGAVVTTSGLDAVTGFDPTTTNLMMPAFSPDGTKLAVIVSPGDLRDNVIPTIPNPNPSGLTETLAYLDFDESGPTFSPALHNVTDSTAAAFATTGQGLAYPSFTPDSSAIAFHSGTYSTGCNALGCDDTTADNGDLFITDLTGGAPIRLATTDDPPNVADHFSSVEPTFNPVQRGGYSWVVFTSMRAYGNQPWPSDVTATGLVNGKRRLWVAAVDTKLGTVDPSHPAIYLDGQADTPNMRGFWTLAACIATPKTPPKADAAPECTSGFQCCSGFCEDGVCKNVNQVACSGVGGSCTSGADCCNPSVVECKDDLCSVPPPK